MKISWATFYFALICLCSTNLAHSENNSTYLRNTCFQGYKNKLPRTDVETACRQFISSPNLTGTDKPDAYNALGLMAFYNDDFKQALKVFDEALLQFPDFQNIIFNRGLVLNYDKNYLEAIKSFEQIQKLSPDFTGTNAGLGDAYIGLQQYDEALKHYSLSVIDSPHLEYNYRTLGFLQMGANKPKDAVENLESAARISSQDTQFPRAAALFAYIAGDLKSAKEDTEKAFKVSPKNSYLPILRYLISRAEGKDDTAELERGAILSTEQNSWSGYIIKYLLGKTTPEQLVADGAGDKESTDARNVETYFYAGESELLKNNRAKALSYFKEGAKTVVPNAAEYWAAQGRVKELEGHSSTQTH